MEKLLKQMRVRFSGLGEEGQEPNGIKDSSIPSQKTVPFKTERQRWFRRQMSRDGNSSDDEDFKTAVAAAAYVVNSLEEAEKLDTLKRRPPSIQMERPLDKANTQKEERSPGQISRPPTVKKVKEDDTPFPGETSNRTPALIDQKGPEKVPSVRKVTTFPEKKQDSSDSVKPARTPAAWPAGDEQNQKLARTEADAWERAELAKVQKRYEKMSSSILSWEGEKKAKARHHLDKTERKADRKRAKASKEYHREMARIEKIAREARAAAEEKKRNDEARTREKAGQFRSTGSLPATYFCF